MIKTKLIGGLGNQMFQYAAGRRLSYVHNTPLQLDISDLKRLKTRKYELDCFNIKGEIIERQNNDLFGKIVKRLTNRENIYFEKNFRFDRAILNLPDNVTLVGYWQSEKYFSDIEGIIRKELNFKHSPIGKIRSILRKVRSSESVAIHFRRTDYIDNKKFFYYHGVCSLDYYQKAISLIAERLKSPEFFIFSDDLPWVKRNLKIEHPAFFVDLNDKDYEDLRLMSSCRHQIIANSTFSWWGAWLNENKHKIVVCPKNWFRNKSINTEDLIPYTWIRI